MKKTILTVSVVLLFTIFFVLVFRYTSDATDVVTESNEETQEIATKEDVLDNDVADEETNVSSEEGILETESALQTETAVDKEENVDSVDTNEEALFDEEEFDIKLYLREKIAPVATGVLTAVIAIILALTPLVKAIKAFKDLISSFSKKDEERNKDAKESNEQIQKSVERIEASVKDVSEYKKELDELKKTQRLLTKVMVLGFSSNSEVVRSGKGKKMTLLLNKLEEGEEE